MVTDEESFRELAIRWWRWNANLGELDTKLSPFPPRGILGAYLSHLCSPSHPPGEILRSNQSLGLFSGQKNENRWDKQRVIWHFQTPSCDFRAKLGWNSHSRRLAILKHTIEQHVVKPWLYVVQNIYSPPKKTPYPLSISPHCPLPWPLDPAICFLSPRIYFFWTFPISGIL